jgi:cobalt-zinc-cadmium efflux system membrane fusion protein
MIKSNKKNLFLVTFVSVLALTGGGILYKSTSVLASTEQAAEASAHVEEKGTGHGDTHGEGHEEEESKVKLDPQAIANMNIEVVEAMAGVVHASIPVTGRIVLNQNATAEVKARFAGVVKSVTKTQGEMVKSGDTLATVESNDSLQVYPIKSPITGIVLERNTNIGHVAGDESLFTIADLSKPWVEFHIFPKDMISVTTGQRIRVNAVGSDLAADSTISTLLPTAEMASQTVVARAEIDNSGGKWRPGMSVHGDIFTEEKNVPVAIKIAAIQRLGEKSVVFVEKDGSFEAKPVTLGLQDGTWAEVTAGLQAGEKYAADNSFVLKAEAGKAGAEHAD